MTEGNSNQTLANLKALKTNTSIKANEFQKQVIQARQKLEEVKKAIDTKRAKFEEETNVASVAPIVEPTVAVKEIPVEVAPTPVEKPVAKPVKKVEKTESKADTVVPNNEPTKVEKVSTEKPKTDKVADTPVNSGERTYKDAQGNVKVRKFLQVAPVLPPKTSIAKPQYGNNANGNRRPYQPHDNNNRDNRENRDNNSQGYNRDNKRFAPNNRPPQQFQKPSFGAGNKEEDAPQRSNTKAIAKKPAMAGGFATPFPQNQPQKTYGNKNKTHEKSDKERSVNKKALLTKSYSEYGDDDAMIARRPRQTKKSDTKVEQVIKKIDKAVIGTENVSIKVLSEKTGIAVAAIIKQLFKEGIIKTINDEIEFAIAAYVCSIFGVELEQKIDKTAEETIMNGEDTSMPDDTKRPPIVTVMGHVDHGKTSLLDAIRKTNVTSGEAGGITQHIGAYTVQINGEQITFIDTPGHAAFTAMRARGAKVTDVAIIVVAADDGVMPQTIEAINHAKAAEVSILVAINKMDKPTANVDKVKQQLTEYDLISEEWGGDTIMVPVSAKSRQGIDTLLESVLLVTEIKELKANPKKKASGTVIEAKVDKNRGPLATILVRNGTLHVGDSVIAGTATGKIKAMYDDKGAKVKQALPSCPVEVLGFSDVPEAGDFMYVADEKLVRKVAEERRTKVKIESAKTNATISLDELYGKISEGQLKNLNIIIKTDVQGSLEALKLSLMKISNDEVKISPIHGGVGAINETDIMLAKASQAIIIGFNVRASASARVLAEHEGVDIRLYSVIYDAVDDVTAAMKGMLAPKYKENIIGQIQVREIYRISGVGTVAGAYVTNGKVTRGSKIRLFRNDVVVHDGEILALKRFKDDVKEVVSGFECGISLQDFNDIKIDDIMEAYVMEQIVE